jgi:hypothetical protein
MGADSEIATTSAKGIKAKAVKKQTIAPRPMTARVICEPARRVRSKESPPLRASTGKIGTKAKRLRKKMIWTGE